MEVIIIVQLQLICEKHLMESDMAWICSISYQLISYAITRSFNASGATEADYPKPLNIIYQ